MRFVDPIVRYNWDGLSVPGCDKIYLGSEYSWTRKLEVFFHELIHSLLFRFDVEREEELCVLLGERLAQVFRDNQEKFVGVLKWMKENSNE